MTEVETDITRLRLLLGFFVATTILLASLIAAPSFRSEYGPLKLLESEGSEMEPLRPADEAPCNRSRRGGALNYFIQPDTFVNTFARCIRDDNCRIYYQHVGKTGGTTIEARMFGLFPVSFDHKSCCASSMVERFQKHKDQFCKAKFTSYQVLGDVFEGILSECEPSSDGGWSIALTSFREPIQRALSSIHRTCNKELGKRSGEKMEACLRCSYDDDKDIWDKHVQKTNKMYKGVAYTSRIRMPNVRIMTIDTVDIDAFFEKLQADMSPKWNVSLSVVKNAEKVGTCSFGMKSPIFKALAESEAIYRNLTLGI